MVVWRGGHAIPGLMLSLTSSSSSRSLGRPSPARIRYRICCSQVVPSRHGVHLPHDSWAKKRTIRAHAFTASVVWSMTTTAPEPSMEPALSTVAFDSGRSRCSS
jgi:hypothetical protein